VARSLAASHPPPSGPPEETSVRRIARRATPALCLSFGLALPSLAQGWQPQRLVELVQPWQQRRAAAPTSSRT
jgi:hypothetical protein